MINLQGIRTRSFAPFESKGIFTKKKKKKKHHLSESKTLDKNFHSRSNEKYFREFFTNYTESKKKKEITIGQTQFERIQFAKNTFENSGKEFHQKKFTPSI